MQLSYRYLFVGLSAGALVACDSSEPDEGEPTRPDSAAAFATAADCGEVPNDPVRIEGGRFTMGQDGQMLCGWPKYSVLPAMQPEARQCAMTMRQRRPVATSVPPVLAKRGYGRGYYLVSWMNIYLIYKGILPKAESHPLRHRPLQADPMRSGIARGLHPSSVLLLACLLSPADMILEGSIPSAEIIDSHRQLTMVGSSSGRRSDGRNSWSVRDRLSNSARVFAIPDS